MSMGKVKGAFKLVSWLWRNKIYLATIGSMIAKIRGKKQP
jgi:hypothetical protein|tara:strand:- start:6 stop:125 length:120 start_codon:yes stop_codon:yes gene_type:complete